MEGPPAAHSLSEQRGEERDRQLIQVEDEELVRVVALEVGEYVYYLAHVAGCRQQVFAPLDHSEDVLYLVYLELLLLHAFAASTLLVAQVDDHVIKVPDSIKSVNINSQFQNFLNFSFFDP